jgi:phosphoribosyl 1,2-cyclic phosphate phosphodiesterase
MRLTFLGTGTSHGVPMIACGCEVCRSVDPHDKRLRSSVILQTDGGRAILIDAGPDFRQQMLREHITCLDAILLTHEHKDHIGGLDDVRAFNHFMQRSIPVYANEKTIAAVRHDYAYAFAKGRYAGLPEMKLHNITEEPFLAAGITIAPICGLHYRLPVLGFRIADTVYITDMNYLPPASIQRIKGCKTLIINALRKEKHASHFTLDEALQIIDAAKPARAYLTHISHQMGLHTEVQKELPPNVFLAYDGLTLENWG